MSEIKYKICNCFAKGTVRYHSFAKMNLHSAFQHASIAQNRNRATNQYTLDYDEKVRETPSVLRG